MMKNTLLILILAALLSLTAAASADPVLTADNGTVWLGAENHLYFRDPAGVVKQLPSAIGDLIGMDGDNIYCLSMSGRLYAVRMDGSATVQVSAAPTAEELDALRAAPVFALTENRLVRLLPDGTEVAVSEKAIAACAGADTLYFAEENGGRFELKALPLNAEAGAMAPIPETVALVQRPAGMTAGQGTVALLTPEGIIQVYQAADATLTTFGAYAEQVDAAAAEDGMLFRYAKREDGMWVVQQTEPLTATVTAVPVTVTPAPAVLTPAPAVLTPAPAPLTPTPRPAPTEAPQDNTVRKWDRGNRVRRIQQRLADLGYPVGKVDGTYGDQTDVAVRLFQSSIGVAEHTYLTEKVQNRLFSSSAPAYDPYVTLARGSKGIRVRLMQQALAAVGYDPGTVDGVYGTKTVAAVAAYQQALNMVLAPGEVPGEVASSWLLMNLYGLLNPVTPLPFPVDPATDAPVVSPTVYPVDVPTDPPATDPTDPPIVEPIDPPVTDPTDPPAADPTDPVDPPLVEPIVPAPDPDPSGQPATPTDLIP